jgi:hypothetical protein
VLALFPGRYSQTVEVLDFKRLVGNPITYMSTKTPRLDPAFEVGDDLGGVCCFPVISDMPAAYTGSAAMHGIQALRGD